MVSAREKHQNDQMLEQSW